jgi:ADP-ribose pyrophosphatase YjhB (NUDIX family)
VKRGESLVKAIKRELYEETGLRVEIGSLLGVLDRCDKDSITLLFAAVSNKSSIKVKQNNKEIKKATFRHPYRRKLRHQRNTFGQPGEAQLRSLRKFEVQLTSSRRSCELRRPLPGQCMFAADLLPARNEKRFRAVYEQAHRKRRRR